MCRNDAKELHALSLTPSFRRDAEERWRLRRKEREEVAIEEERIERAQKEEAAAIASARRAKERLSHASMGA